MKPVLTEEDKKSIKELPARLVGLYIEALKKVRSNADATKSGFRKIRGVKK